MGLAKTASSAMNLLIDIGYFPVHVNLDLLKFNIPFDYPDEVRSAAENLLTESFDPDEVTQLFLMKSFDPFLQFIKRWKFWLITYHNRIFGENNLEEILII